MYKLSGIVILSFILLFVLSHGVLFLLVSSGMPAQAVRQHPWTVRKCGRVGAFLCGRPGEN
jgi:hypothetical protein